MAKVDFIKIEAEKRQLFLERISRIFGVDIVKAEKIARLLPGSAVRINHLIDQENCQFGKNSRLGDISWIRDAWWILRDKDILTRSEDAEAGRIIFQNPSSFLPVLALEPKEDEVILDVCAAPGGKIAHVADLTNNKAKIWVNDANRERMFKMQATLKRYGVRIEKTTIFPAQILSKVLQDKFDKILVDAPCSGEGMMNIFSDEDIKNWSTKRIHRLSKLQKRIILSAFDLLKPGGTLVYSTCTMAPEENEGVVNELLKKRSNAEIIELKLPRVYLWDGLNSWGTDVFSSELSKTKRVLPDGKMEAFYIAKIKKT